MDWLNLIFGFGLGVAVTLMSVMLLAMFYSISKIDETIKEAANDKEFKKEVEKRGL